jgi:isoleucyl-tRNA synthetase
MYQGLVVSQRDGATGPASVHHEDYPEAAEALIDSALEQEMAAVRVVVGLGRGLRVAEGLKVRQPLQTITVVSHDPAVRRAVETHAGLIAEELNVKQVLSSQDEASLAHLTFKPNYRALGPRFGARMKDAAAVIEALDPATVETLIDGGIVDVLGVPITLADLIMEREPRDGIAVAAGDTLSVALDTDLTQDLRVEGIAREIVKVVQGLRRSAGFAVSDRIRLSWDSDSPLAVAAMDIHGDWIIAETLATTTERSGSGNQVDVADGVQITLGVRPVI